MATGVKTRREKFTEVYQKNTWRGTESVSGTGSAIQQTILLQQALPKLFRELGVKSIVDAPCGDFHWMKNVAMHVDYVGVDIVEELVGRLNELHATPTRRFECVDLVTEILPRADLILCRDCLVHLPLAEAEIAVRQFIKSGATWLLTTTFPHTTENGDVRWSGWRPLNLEISPFNFPVPQRLIVEGCTEDGGKYADKSLGLWRLADLAERI
jgi:hypothetical protein